MSLIVTDKHDGDELARWRMLERQDALVARQRGHQRRVDDARRALERFAKGGPFYVGVSWGKDSVCLAHLAATVAPDMPLVWVRHEPIRNPECFLVRDQYLSQSSQTYREVEYEVPPFQFEEGSRHRMRDVDMAAAVGTDRYASGVCAHESTARGRRMRTYGHETARTVAPMGWWTSADVFAYLHTHDLPVHPAYAYTAHGAWSRERIRVDALWGHMGTGHGRREWERRYYPEELSRVRAWCEQHVGT